MTMTLKCPQIQSQRICFSNFPYGHAPRPPIIIIINTGQTELADSAQGTALSQIKTIHIVIYITIDKKSMSNYEKFS